MGRAHIVAVMVAAIGFLASVAYGMDWANTAHDFARNYLSVVPQDQLAGIVARWLFDFFLQPVFVVGSTSVPLAFLLILVGGGVVYLSRRRQIVDLLLLQGAVRLTGYRGSSC